MIDHVVVIGGGTMGAGIVEVLLGTGATVHLVEPDPASLDRVRAELSSERLTVAPALDLQDATLVIEAVPEDLVLKQQVLTRAERCVPESCVLASNTSSVPIGRIGRDLRRPERLVGMHFFNPVPRSELVEIVVAPTTGAAAVVAARSWSERLGKTAIEVRDSPGFATSRLGLALGLEAIRMVEDCVADVADIDLAMKLGYKHPIGPLKLTDLVGLDVRLAIARQLAAELGPRFEPPRLLVDKVEAGELGKKSGQGFYPWL